MTRKATSQRTKLDNGAVVVTTELPHLQSAHLTVMLRGGPVHEDDDAWGLSHIVEHMVFRGTARHKDARAVSLAADEFGGEIGGSTWRDRVAYDTQLDPGEVGAAFALIYDMLGTPRFEGLAIEKDVLREELLENVNDDGQEIDPDNLAARRVFDGHPLARSIEGTLAHLDRCDLKAVRRFHKEAYGPEHMVLSVAGPVTHAEATAAARATFGALEPGSGPRAGKAPPPLGPLTAPLVVREDDSQTQVRLSFPCGGLFDESRTATALLARILDDGPAARLPARLIDGEGLAYSLWCDLDLYEARGSLDVGAQVAHERVGELCEKVCRELTALARRAPAQQEVERVKRRVQRGMRDLVDDPASYSEAAARGELVGQPFDPSLVLSRVNAVDAPAVRRAAAEVFRSAAAVLVLVGLPSKKEIQRATRALQETLG
jgi:predicted Zn-dependent peptidase